MAISLQTTEFNLIYVYGRESIPGALKIGKTTVKAIHMEDLTPDCEALNVAAIERIKQETVTAGVFDAKLLYTEVACFKDEEGNTKCFEDKDVHRVLDNSHFDKRIIEVMGSFPTEWYEVNLEQAKKAIAAIKNNQEVIDGPVKPKVKHEKIDFREEQSAAINQTMDSYAPGGKILWNAKMRFGKTLCALEFIRRNPKINRTLILTHRPTVRSGWFDDYHKLDFEKYQYGSKSGEKYAKLDSEDTHGKDFATLEDQYVKQGLRYIYFASMQDLRGSSDVSDKGIDKNHEVFKTDWDLIILDEAHEGTQTPLGQNVIKGLSVGRSPFFIYLSGTPFNILSQFDKEEIYTWDYVMEQDAKARWAESHPREKNPYEGLAKLNIYTYNIGSVFENNSYKKSDEDYFNFSEFFRVWTGDSAKDGIEMDNSSELGGFIHEEDVVRFLDLLCQEEPISYYPYSNREFCDALSHTLWMVPGVKQAAALEKVINGHKIHKELGFSVVNVAGNGSKIEELDPDDAGKIEKQEKDALKKVKKAIKNNSRTITLSCGRLTTGVSVPEWTGVFMLSGGYSTGAAIYMQTIFRGQTPFKNGGIKTNCYAFDFAPDRTLTVIDDYIKMQPSSKNVSRHSGGEGVDIENFLRFCPVISMEGGQEKDYDAKSFIHKVNDAYASIVIGNGFKSRHLFKNYAEFTDADHELLAQIGKALDGKAVNLDSDGKVKMSESGLTGEGKKKGRTTRKGAGAEPKVNKPKNTEQEKRRNSQKVLDLIFVRLPLLLFGAVDEPKGLTINELISDAVVDNDSWAEFMPKGFTKAMMLQIAHLVKIDVLIASAERTIQEAKDADDLSVEERALKISQMISRFHFPDKETILTPWWVVNMHLSRTIGGFDFYNSDNHTSLLDPRFVDSGSITSDVFFSPDAHLLEINSKSGVYPLYLAYSFYRIHCDIIHDGPLTGEDRNRIWEKVLRENIFVLCKTEMAKKITHRVLAGYKEHKTNCKVYPGLVGILRANNKNRKQALVKTLRSTKYWTGINNGDMDFKAVVGNPPYQVTVAKKETENGQKRSSSIFHLFQLLGDQLAQYTSLIYPAGRWIHQSGKGMKQFGHDQINDSHLLQLEVFPDAKEVFSNAAAIADGISIVLKDMKKGTPGFQYVYTEGGSSSKTFMENPGKTLMPLNPLNKIIADQINATVEKRGFSFLHDSVLSQKLFSIESDFVEKNPTLVRLFSPGDEFDKTTEIKLFTNDKSGKAGRARWYITNKSVITTGLEYLGKWKVVVSSANAGGQKRSNRIEVLDRYSAFGRARVALKTFSSKKEAENFYTYATSELIRFSFLLTDESLTSFAKRTPDILNYKDDNGIIDFAKDVNEQLYEIFSISTTQRDQIKAILAKYNHNQS